ncbi:lytic murein transglycosylase [Vibrio sp. S9_S30]|uniref:lytic murein transglycosylase n=1 Tax=Vibrio sp. S9_S30 TaxID=2720226 RepID=UPI001680C09B|nr:lytic murein transglycosylase [Vibrio sp. S9_S30]MBD1559077.1 lytic murein transglycosylase [Vibrio sp. S9_S30]
MKKLLVALLSLGLSHVAVAQPDFDEYVIGLKAEALEKGISQSIIDKAFENVTYKPRAVKADRNQPEKKLTLDEYIPRAVPDWKVKQARELYKQHYTELKRIGDEYGVQPRFIVALWGVESNFGKLTGGYSVIDALTTLSFDGRREAFFRKETMAALTILDQGHISPQNMKGSWAGAMGQCQFMPSSFLAYAADGNKDGKKDIWNTKADVFASTANYLSQSGWDDRYTWGRQVTVPTGFDMSLEGRQKAKAKTLAEWSKLGVTRINGKALPQPKEDIDAWLIMPDDENGRAYLIYNNYQVLMKWNRSYYFGIAVSHLADKIKFSL